jgi:hypothetical protein
VFESVNAHNASFNVETVSADIDAMVAASHSRSSTHSLLLLCHLSCRSPSSAHSFALARTLFTRSLCTYYLSFLSSLTIFHTLSSAYALPLTPFSHSLSSLSSTRSLDKVSADLDAIVAASQSFNGTKAVFVQTWPGMYVDTHFTPSAQGPASVYPPVADGGEPTPQNNAEWRSALRSHFSFAHALFLSVAEDNTYWFYGGYWCVALASTPVCDEHCIVVSPCPTLHSSRCR